MTEAWISVSSPTAQYEYNPLILLGKGNFGSVYPARLKGNPNPRDLCVKMIKLQGLDSTKLRVLNREVEISLNLKNLKNRNLVETYDAFIQNSNGEKYVFIVMEMLILGDLNSYVCQRFLPEDQVLDIIGQCVNGYLGLQAYNVIHRDIKPQNILLTTQDQRLTVKLSDFGVSRMIDQHVDKTKLTRVGSGLYMSPQIVQRQSYTDKCDVFSLGIVFHNLLFQKFNSHLKSMVQLQEFVTQLQLKPHNCKVEGCQQTTSVSDDTIDLLSRMLKYEESDRIGWKELSQHKLIQPFITQQQTSYKFTQFRLPPSSQIKVDNQIASSIISQPQSQEQQSQFQQNTQSTQAHSYDSKSDLGQSIGQQQVYQQSQEVVQDNYVIQQHVLYLQKLINILMNKARVSDLVFQQLQKLFQVHPTLYGCDFTILYGSLIGYSFCIYLNLYYLVNYQLQSINQDIQPFVAQINPNAFTQISQNNQLVQYLQHQIQKFHGYFTLIRQQYQVEKQQEGWVIQMFELQEFNQQPFQAAIKYIQFNRLRQILGQSIITPSDPYLHLRIYYLLELLSRIDFYFPLSNLPSIDETMINQIPADDNLSAALTYIIQQQI